MKQERKRWIAFLILLLIILLLDRCYQQSKFEHQLASLSAETNMPFKQWWIKNAEDLEERRRRFSIANSVNVLGLPPIVSYRDPLSCQETNKPCE